MFISYAQNLEDVVLWRALRDIERGTYVDVGAFDPVVDSVTWAFYRHGWRGALVEPVPWLASALRDRRPGDLTIAVAAGAEHGSATMIAAPGTGRSTLVDAHAAITDESQAALEEIVVPVAPLDDLLSDVGFDGRAIHFCTIDVEGFEAEALAGFDLERWRPWVLVVEATKPDTPEPAYDAWEPGVLDAGYRFCLFDGLNRFYIAEEHARSIGPLLSYPAGVFDQPFERAQNVEAHAALDRANAHVDWLEDTNAYLHRRLSTIEGTFSWKVTRPLRAARRLQLGRSRVRSPSPEGTESETEALRSAFADRLVAAASVLDPTLAGDPDGLDGAMSTFERALRRSGASDRASAWLGLVAVDGSYPGESEVDAVARRLRLEGARDVADELHVRFRRAVAQGSATTAGLQVVRNDVVIDVSNTVSTEVWTGIQRVVREAAHRWLTGRHGPTFVAFDLRHGFARPLLPPELAVIETRHVGSAEPGAVEPASARRFGPEKVVIPWGCRLVLPELVAEPRRCDAYRSLATAGVLDSLSIIGYDLVPLIASETAADGMPANFVDYLSVVKHADRISTISRSTAEGYAAFAAMNAAQGIPPPVVEAQSLPAEVPGLPEDSITAARQRLAVGTLPLVLVVGSHEPRKNHMRVLEAAERLWTSGLRFELLFVGGSSWKSEDFEAFAGRLASVGRPIRIVRRASEVDLWAAYRVARFTVFPSLLEGFGLPVVESLAVGTPAITSRHGSMGEIAEGGGCLLVDPRDVGSLETEMERLLRDDELLGRLRGEAAARQQQSWAEYADEVWAFLVGPAPGEHLSG